MVKSMKILLVMDRRLPRVRKATRGRVALQKLLERRFPASSPGGFHVMKNASERISDVTGMQMSGSA
jgi:hypothetical protein